MTAVDQVEHPHTLLKNWVLEQLNLSDEAALIWQPLAGDASFRRYFRCEAGGQNYIAALAPPETEKNHEFVQVADLLAEANVMAPRIIASDFERGHLLQSDLGTTLLADVLTPETVSDWYDKAMDMVLAFQSMPVASVEPLGFYDRDALALELSYFRTWFVEKLLAYSMTEDESAMLQGFFDQLLNHLVAQPAGFVHRDFHSRNIMVTGEGELATIDFQDALYGPVTYDLVSLLRDCYIHWPVAQVEAWVADFYQKFQAKYPSQAADWSAEEFQRDFDRMGLQRHIKVLGVFARLAIRDNKPAYLDDLPLVIHYVRSVAARLPEAKEFLSWFDQVLMPRTKQHQWGENL